jgi:hypothetical protein
MEISCQHRGVGVHLLAYLVDPHEQALAQELAKVLAGRSSRLPAILERLRGLGIDIDVRTCAASRATPLPRGDRTSLMP